MTTPIREKIKEIGELNHLLANNLVDCIWVVDASTLKYEYISPSVVKMNGYTARELLNETFTNRLSTDSLKRVREQLADALNDYEKGRNIARSLELELIHKNGDTFWVEVRAKAFKDPDGDYKVVGISKEITKRKVAEQKQEDLNRKLSAALAEKERLIEEMKVLRRLLPICSACKRIRDDKGKWWPLDIYISEHTHSDVTHTICSDCAEVLYQK